MRKEYVKPAVKHVMDMSKYGPLLMQELSGVKVNSYSSPNNYHESIGYGKGTDNGNLLFSRESDFNWFED